MTDLAELLLRRRVEHLLAPWDRSNGPGVTLGIVLGDALVAHHSAGMANIELGVPIGPTTTFRIASVSKQFTCAAVLLLAAEGKLSIDDDVRAHLPMLPELGHRITLAHLMHNTSGIRDMLEIMRAGGVDLGQPCKPEDLLEGVCRQRGLNFVPGSRYLYSNSNFMLLGRIVEQVSGEAFGSYLQRRIFTPLGMNAMRHVAQPNELVTNLATGYFPAPGGWRRAAHAFPLHGEGGLVSSVADLALWHVHFSSPRVGGPALATALTTQTSFNNGTPNTYARGLRIKPYRGVRTVGHDGLWPGFKTSFVRIPDLDAAVICISNDATSDPHDLAFQAVDTLLEGKPSVHPVLAMPPQEALAGLAGRYLNRDTGATVDVSIDDKGRVVASTHGVSFSTIPTADGRLTTSRGSADFTMRLAADGDTLQVERDAGVQESLHRIAPGAVLPPDLNGAYHNADAAATWTIDGNSLRISGPLLAAAGPWDIEPIENDFFRVITPLGLYRGWFDARVVRNAAGKVTGLRADAGRVKGWSFGRLD